MLNKAITSFYAAFLLSIINLIFAIPAFACSCAPITPEQALQQADVAFVGKLQKIEATERLEGMMDLPIIVTFSVEKALKGTTVTEITLHTAQNGASCEGYFFKEGLRYEVYAYRKKAGDTPWKSLVNSSKEILGVSLCGGTKEYNP